MRVVIFALLLMTCFVEQVLAQTINANIVNMRPEFPRVGEVIELTLNYLNLNVRIQDRFYTYQNSDSVVFEKIDFQGIVAEKVVIRVRVRAKHSGVVHIPPIVETALDTIVIPPISVLSTMDSQFNVSALHSQALVRTHPPFPISEILYLFLAFVSLSVFLGAVLVLAREISPMARTLVKQMHNACNVMGASYVVKRLLRRTRNMEKPTFTHETISSMYFYAQIYKAIEMRFCFLYGPKFKTFTTDEMENFLLRDMAHALELYRVPLHRYLSQEVLHDFFNTMREVLYGKKLSELSIRINHCHVVLRLFFVSKYIFKTQKIRDKDEAGSLFRGVLNRSSTKRIV